MSTGITVVITEKPIEYPVELDFSRLTWGDVLKFQEAANLDAAQAQAMLGELVSRITGQDVNAMPGLVVMDVAQAIVSRIKGGDAETAGN